MENKFIIITKDNICFNINKDIIDKSGKLKRIIFEQSTNETIEIEIEGDIFIEILNIIKYEKEKEEYMEKIEMNKIYDIIIGADYLEIEEIIKIGERIIKKIINEK